MLPPKALPSLARFWQHLNSGMNRAFNWKQASPRIIQRLLLEQLLLLLLPPPLLPLPLLMCLLNQHLHASWDEKVPPLKEEAPDQPVQGAQRGASVRQEQMVPHGWQHPQSGVDWPAEVPMTARPPPSAPGMTP